MPEMEAWGDFEIHFNRILGSGATGSVYWARQISLDRPVAVKVLSPAAMRPDFLKRFWQEGRLLAKVRDPRVVVVYQAGENNGHNWYAMELLEGETLQARLDRGEIPYGEAIRIVREVARGLAAALKQGIIHRDVKPGNIFLSQDGQVKVADFGLSKALFADQKLTEMGEILGTFAYMAPEQARGLEVDHRADIYSLGAVLYEMVTQSPPFGSQDSVELLYKQAHEEPPHPRTLVPDLNPGVERVILKCLAKDPANRFQTYEDLIAELDEALDESARRELAGLTAGPMEDGSSPPRPFNVLWVAGPVLSLGAGIIIVTLLWPSLRPLASGPIQPDRTLSFSSSTPPPSLPRVEPSSPSESAPASAEPASHPDILQATVPVGPDRGLIAESLLATRYLSSEDLSAIEGLYEHLSRYDEDLRARRYEAARRSLESFDAAGSEVARILKESELERLSVLQEEVNVFLERCRTSSDISFTLKSGDRVSGPVIEVGHESLLVGTQEVRFLDVVPTSDRRARLFFDAAEGRAVEALIVWIDEMDERSLGMLHLPGLFRAACRDAVRSIADGNGEPAEILLKEIERHGGVLRLPWIWSETLVTDVERELAAYTLFSQEESKVFWDVMERYEGTHGAKFALERIEAKFTASAQTDVALETQKSLWQHRTGARSGDPGTFEANRDGFQLHDFSGISWIERKVPEAKQGYRIEFKWEPLPEGRRPAFMAIYRFRADEDYDLVSFEEGRFLALRRTGPAPENFEIMASYRPQDAGGHHTLSFVSCGDRLLIYADGTLFWRGDILDEAMRLGVVEGEASIKRVRVKR